MESRKKVEMRMVGMIEYGESATTSSATSSSDKATHFEHLTLIDCSAIIGSKWCRQLSFDGISYAMKQEPRHTKSTTDVREGKKCLKK